MNPYETLPAAAAADAALADIAIRPMRRMLIAQLLSLAFVLILSVLSCGMCAGLMWVAPAIGAMAWGLFLGRKHPAMPLGSAVAPGMAAGGGYAVLQAILLGLGLAFLPVEAGELSVLEKYNAVTLVATSMLLTLVLAAEAVGGGVVGLAVGSRLAPRSPAP